MTLRDLVERYQAGGRPHMPRRQCHNPRKYFQRYSWAAAVACAHVVAHRKVPLGDLSMAEITRQDLEALRDELLAQKRAGQTAAQIVLIISTTCRWAVAHQLIPEITLPGIWLPSSVRAEEVYSRAAFEAILQVARTHSLYHYALLMTALNTGMRKGELFGLRRSNVLMGESRIWCRHSYDSPPKSGKPRPIPISPDLLPVLRDWLACCPTAAGDLVFPVWVDDKGRGYWRMGRPYDMAGLPEILAEASVNEPVHPWHAFRHTFASQFMQRRGKAYIYSLKEILGHSDLKTTELYLHWAPDWVSDDLAGLNLRPTNDKKK